MDIAVKTVDKKPRVPTAKRQLYSVEELFDRIDNKFIKFYGEYGRKIVNSRRNEWNQDNVVDLKML